MPQSCFSDTYTSVYVAQFTFTFNCAIFNPCWLVVSCFSVFLYVFWFYF